MKYKVPWLPERANISTVSGKLANAMEPLAPSVQVIVNTKYMAFPLFLRHIDPRTPYGATPG